MDNTRANVLSMWFTHISHGVRYAVQNTSCFQNVNRSIYIYIYIYIYHQRSYSIAAPPSLTPRPTTTIAKTVLKKPQKPLTTLCCYVGMLLCCWKRLSV